MSGDGKGCAPAAPTVLIAEDEAMLRDLMAAVLTRAGFTVLKAGHALEALLRNREHAGPVDLLLTDICMPPHLNGRELAGLIRKVRPAIAVLYVSGSFEDAHVTREVEVGLSRFLPKPFSPDTLLAQVLSVLGRREAPVPGLER